MSFDPREYEGQTFDDEHGYTEARERAELQAREDAVERERELQFRDTPFCEDACYATMIHTVACQAVNEPVTAALTSWRRAVAPRMAEIGNGLFVRVGTGKGKKRRAA